jgi:hypothetical protein
VLFDATSVPADRGGVGRYVDGLLGALNNMDSNMVVVAQRSDHERYTRLLPNAVIAFECEAYGRHDGGDHEIFVGRVVELHENHAKRGHPLVFFGGQYRRRSKCAGRQC